MKNYSRKLMQYYRLQKYVNVWIIIYVRYVKQLKRLRTKPKIAEQDKELEVYNAYGDNGLFIGKKPTK